MQEETAVAFCPSFNSYSSGKVAEAADKVRKEVGLDSKLAEEDEEELDVDDDFEFSLVRCDTDTGADAFTVPADDMFYGGQIRPIFPIFNRDLLLDESRGLDHPTGEVPSIRTPLKKLFFEDHDPPSSSSSEADELESVPPGTYCFWTPPKAAEASPGRCKKSKSTGSSSRRWRFRDLLRRSNSDGKESFVFLTRTATTSGGKKEEKSEKTEKAASSKQRRSSDEFLAGKAKAKSPNEHHNEKVLSAHEIFYVKNRALKEGEKRRSYLPYRKDLVGFFANVNGFSRDLPVYPPF